MAPTTVTMHHLGPVFCEFLVAHPGTTMELALVDRSTNPAETGFDLAISGRTASYEGVVDVPLYPVRPVLCAAPRFVQAHGELTHPRDLADGPQELRGAAVADHRFGALLPLLQDRG